MKRILMMAVMALSLLAVRAQELTVNSISAAVFDATANSPATERKDLNGELCALIKVQLPLANAEFMGNIVGETVNHSGEYWVYVIDGTRQLHLHHGLIKPLVIYFPDFGIKGVEGGVTYIVDLSVPKELWGVTGEASSRKPLENFLVLRVTPANAKVFVGGSERTVSNGTCSIVLTAGTYPVRVEASGYQAEEFQVTIGDRKVERTVVLHSTMPTLTVTSATPGAEILINGTVAGVDRWEGALMPDTYVVELRKEGFRPSERRVTLLSAASETLEFPSLMPLTGEMTVSSDPIGATVEFDGRPLGTTPDIFRDLPVGSHTVRLSLPGFQPYTSNVTISEATPASLNLTLSAQQESAATTVADHESASAVPDSVKLYSHLDMALECISEQEARYIYFSEAEWKGLSKKAKEAYYKAGYHPKGVVIDLPLITTPFILRLTDSGADIPHGVIMDLGLNLPDKSQKEALLSDAARVTKALKTFGGDKKIYAFWTNEPYADGPWVILDEGFKFNKNQPVKLRIREVEKVE